MVKLICCTLLSHGVVWQKSFQILPFHHELCLHWPMKSKYSSVKKMEIFDYYTDIDDYLKIKGIDVQYYTIYSGSSSLSAHRFLRLLRPLTTAI